MKREEKANELFEKAVKHFDWDYMIFSDDIDIRRGVEIDFLNTAYVPQVYSNLSPDFGFNYDYIYDAIKNSDFYKENFGGIRSDDDFENLYNSFKEKVKTYVDGIIEADIKKDTKNIIEELQSNSEQYFGILEHFNPSELIEYVETHYKPSLDDVIKSAQEKASNKTIPDNSAKDKTL